MCTIAGLLTSCNAHDSKQVKNLQRFAIDTLARGRIQFQCSTTEFETHSVLDKTRRVPVGKAVSSSFFPTPTTETRRNSCGSPTFRHDTMSVTTRLHSRLAPRNTVTDAVQIAPLVANIYRQTESCTAVNFFPTVPSLPNDASRTKW
ncbi:hypothetical protein PsorP6_005613 [Peronosclerospora sorghi]|uniref:Uncharacterized protein n=1 Tax=Peronosclerospora sorghi TaxID=230839 RepID=A0ACC0W2Q5_9STRA|nr:hypothetical protein PsorP6_005613 [Peronosclerospora sorghi]